jgi:hypothetical protein
VQSFSPKIYLSIRNEEVLSKQNGANFSNAEENKLPLLSREEIRKIPPQEVKEILITRLFSELNIASISCDERTSNEIFSSGVRPYTCEREVESKVKKFVTGEGKKERESIQRYSYPCEDCVSAKIILRDGTIVKYKGRPCPFFEEDKIIQISAPLSLGEKVQLLRGYRQKCLLHNYRREIWLSISY